jgi:hypothetical protein
MSGRAFLAELALGFVLAGGISAPPGRGDAQAAPDPAKAKLEAARITYEALLEVHRQGQAGFDAEKVYLWSRRWMEAERDLSEKKADRAAAAEAHLDRMKDLRKLDVARYKAGQGTKAEALGADFYVAEAELWLARVKGK